MKRILIVTGQSGSGKTSALQILEDLGYYCIDNLPLALLPEIVKKINEDNQIELLALCIDIRSANMELQDFNHIVMQLHYYSTVEIIYLTAQDQELINRFNATRRPHPLAHRFQSLNQAIQEEKTILAALQHNASLHIDTTDKNVHDLKHTLLAKLGHSQNLVLILQSFGYKYGIPLDTDFLFDVRHLPNPHWDLELRRYSGLDAPIQQFLDHSEEMHETFQDLQALFSKWLPVFSRGHRQYVTVSIGCTGGQHRSVYMVHRLKQVLEAQWSVQILHREMKHWS